MMRAELLSIGGFGLVSCALSPPPETPVCGCSPTEPPEIVRVLDSSGKPIAGVRVFNGRNDPDGPNFTEVFPLTKEDGSVKVEEPSILLGLDQEGELAASWNNKSLTFGRSGSVVLKFTNGTGLPVANRWVELVPTQDDKPLGRTGQLGKFNDLGPRLTPVLSERTNDAGTIEFKNLSSGLRFQVRTHLSKQHDMDLMGSVQVGQHADPVISQRCSLYGHVRDQHGRPITHVAVDLSFTEYWIGSLDNAPSVLGSAYTDASGAYEIRNMPNAQFLWSVEGEFPRPPLMKFGDGRWSRADMVDLQPGRNRCDIKIDRGR